MYYKHDDHHPFPCLHCHPHSYIRMVQHLIERCLLLHMNRDECIKALANHASVQPLVTLTVWRELLKENQDFFQAYFHGVSTRPFDRRSLLRQFGMPKIKLIPREGCQKSSSSLEKATNGRIGHLSV